MALTARQVETARPKEKDYKLSDERGLYLLVKTTGARYWRLKYRIMMERFGRSSVSVMQTAFLQPPVKRFWPFMKSWIWTYCVNYLIVFRKCLK